MSSIQRMDMLKSMLFELDELANNNGLCYTLVGELAESIYENKVFPDNFDHISITMTMGDIERLISIVNNNKDIQREIEYPLNNPNTAGLEIRYCNNDTTLINIRDFGNHVNYGEYIRIYPIYSLNRNKGKKATLLMHMQKTISKSAKRLTSCTKEDLAGVLWAKFCAKIFGKERLVRKAYALFTEIRYIDKWEDIIKYQKIRFGTARYRLSAYNERKNKKPWDIKYIDVDGHNICIAPMAVKKSTERRKLHSKTRVNEIEGVTIPFNEYLTAERVSLLKAIQKEYDSAVRIRNTSKEAQEVITHNWHIYFMTRDVVTLSRAYTDQVIDSIEEYGRTSQYDKYQEAMEPYLEKKAKWKRMNVPFIENERLEKIHSFMDGKIENGKDSE